MNYRCEAKPPEKGIDQFEDLSIALGMLDAGHLAVDAWEHLEKSKDTTQHVMCRNGASVCAMLGAFIGHKLDAIRERVRGNINNALVSEAKADRAYNVLPSEWIW